MSKKKRTTEEERSPSSSSPKATFSKREPITIKENVSVILQPGFYIITSQGEVLTRMVGKVQVQADGTKVKVKVEEPICCRTIAAAKDTCNIANRTSEDNAILCVTVENFAWGE